MKQGEAATAANWGALLKEIAARGLTNVRVIQHDAVEVLQHMLAPESLDGVHIFFPDPWPKKRHHKRRLLQPGFVALLASRLAPHGTLHCATDWEPYAQQMLEVLSAEPRLRNAAASSAVSPRPAASAAVSRCRSSRKCPLSPRPCTWRGERVRVRGSIELRASGCPSPRPSPH